MYIHLRIATLLALDDYSKLQYESETPDEFSLFRQEMNSWIDRNKAQFQANALFADFELKNFGDRILMTRANFRSNPPIQILHLAVLLQYTLKGYIKKTQEMQKNSGFLTSFISPKQYYANNGQLALHLLNDVLFSWMGEGDTAHLTCSSEYAGNLVKYLNGEIEKFLQANSRGQLDAELCNSLQACLDVLAPYDIKIMGSSLDFKRCAFRAVHALDPDFSIGGSATVKVAFSFMNS